MRRSTIVVSATVAGLVGVLTFHTKSAPLALGSLPAELDGPGFDSHDRSGNALKRWLGRWRTARRHTPTTSSTTKFIGNQDRDRGSGQLQLRGLVGVCDRLGLEDHQCPDRIARRWRELQVTVDRPAVDPHSRATGTAGAECEHPRSVRRQLHECRVRTIVAVRAIPAEFQMTRP